MLGDLASRRSLSPSLSIYLDALRFSCSLLVLIAHLKETVFPYVNSDIFVLGNEAVTIFFVLSGFVVAFSTFKKDLDWRDYAVARLARILSVTVPAIFITIILDTLGAYYHADGYVGHANYGAIGPSEVLRYISFTNELWYSNVYLGTNSPYWSLGFEVWYYVLFGLIVFLPRREGFFASLIVALVCGPRIIFYFPLWTLGVITFLIYSEEKSRSRNIIYISLFISTFIYAFAAKNIFGSDSKSIITENSFMKFITHVPYYYLIGIIFCCNIIIFGKLSTIFPNLCPRSAVIIRWLAGATFTLYLTHLPLLIFISNVFPVVKTSIWLGLFSCALTLVFVAAFAEIGERRKSLFVALFRRAFKAHPLT